MSILTGFKKFKDYIKTDAGYVLSSRWTKSDSVIMGDGSDDTNTLEKNCGAIHGITDSLTSESSNIAASAKAVKDVNDSLGNCTFNVQSDGAYITYVPAGGADTVTKKLGKHEAITVTSEFSVIYKSSGTSATISNTTFAVTYAQNSGSYGNSIFATTDYYDITDASHLLYCRSSQTSDTRGQIGNVYLIAEDGTQILLVTQSIPAGFIYQNYIDISSYSGKYKIGFSVNTGTYTLGYGTASGYLTLSSLIIV